MKHQRRIPPLACRAEQGQSLIEAAVGMTVILLIAVAFLHVANVVIDQEAVDQAARIAANAGAVQARLDVACAAAISYAQARLQQAGVLKGATIQIVTAPQPKSYVRGGRIIVTISAQIPGFFGGTQMYTAPPASELIQPGRGRYPVRQGGSACMATT